MLSRRYYLFLMGIVFSSGFLIAFSPGKFLTKLNKQCSLKIKEVFDNFYEVDKGKFYRSQQLKADVLAHYIRQYGIKTVINLRGDNNSPWIQAEKNAVSGSGAVFYSLALSAVQYTKKEDLLELLRIYKEAPKPILVHCIGGADRTGEASALWVLEMQKRPKAEALKQLSLVYGHRQHACPAKDYLIAHWQGEEWLRNEYDSTQCPSLK